MTTEQETTESLAETEDLAGFVIDSREAAAQIVDWMVGCDEKLARLANQYEVKKTAVERRRAGLEFRFGKDLRGFVERELEGRKSRTLHFLEGSCSLRTQPGGLRIDDDKAVLAWAREHLPEVIARHTETKERVMADEIKAYVAATGIRVPGVVMAADEVVFTVKAAKPAKAKG